jgi:hypothetical protein
MDALPASVTHLAGRVIVVSDLESSKLVARRGAGGYELDSDDRSWLEGRLEEYRELLTYLHDY